MRGAYTILGLAFLILIIVTMVLFSRSAPSEGEQEVVSSEQLATNTIEEEPIFTLSSPAFAQGESIPETYTCDGANISPPLSIQNVPEGTQTLVLIMDDPVVSDSLRARNVETFIHWVVYDIDPQTKEFLEGEIPEGAIIGKNTRGETQFFGSCPPERHEYFYRLYALDTISDIGPGATGVQIQQAMEGHIIETAELMGTYERPQKEDV